MIMISQTVSRRRKTRRCLSRSKTEAAIPVLTSYNTDPLLFCQEEKENKLFYCDPSGCIPMRSGAMPWNKLSTEN